jgi:hypothetical protein
MLSPTLINAALGMLLGFREEWNDVYNGFGQASKRLSIA